jgi:integrase
MGRGPGVRAASASSIQVDFRYQGVRCREKLSLPPTPKNLRYAARLKARIEHEIALGQFDYAQHFPASPRAKKLARNRGAVHTMRQILNAWLDSVEAELEPETFADYAADVRNIWIPLYGDWTADQFTGAVARKWVADQSCSRKRILNKLTPLRQAIRMAVSDGILTEDPLAKLQVIRPDEAGEDDEIDPLSPAEFAAVVAQLGLQTANAVTFWAWTGLREGELIALSWPDVDLDQGTIRITKSVRGARTKAPKTKQGRRTVRLLPPALDALKRQQAHTRLAGRQVFQNPSWRPRAGSRWAEPKPGPWTEKALRNAWCAGCEAAGVRYRPPKQLRHTFASWTLSAGESVMWVSRMMGHANSAITQTVYGRFIPDAFPDAGARTLAAVKWAR